MKTEQKRMELSGVIFVFMFFYRSGNEYRNSENKYKTRYCRKQIQTEYGTNMDEKRMIMGTKRLLKSCKKNSRNSSKLDKPTLSQFFGVLGSMRWVA
jgi:hypothetical protein